MSRSIYGVIIAGGGGTRFWPKSRTGRPKQFLSLTGGPTLLQLSRDRLRGLVSDELVWVITADRYVDLVAEQLPDVPPDQIVGEPMGRDTAPCIALAAALIQHNDPDGVMIVTPADHVIEPPQEFQRACRSAVNALEDHPEALITFGIRPTFPAPGYGYIERGEKIAERLGLPVYRVAAFKEKPDIETARQYVRTGRFYWNSGIFIWRAQTILDALRRFVPEIHAAAIAIAEAWNTPQREDVFRHRYASLEKQSIDFAVMERATNVLMIEAPFRWDDVGSWRALERLHPQDAAGNTVLARHHGLDTQGCIIVGDSDKLITTVGVKDLLIVHDGDAILVADKHNEQAVKQLVEHLRSRGLEQHL